MSARKTDHKKHIDELISTVRAVEASDIEQAEKTRKIRAAGERYKNALYYDRRKFSGKNAEKRISLGTFIQYLSRARRQFEDMGLRHHLLDRDLGRMQKRYPCHAVAIESLVGQPPRETRLAKKQLEEELGKAKDLEADIAKIDFSAASAARRIKSLASKHPMYSELLEGLVGEDAQAANRELDKALREIPALRTDLADLKINHEIMYVLQPKKEDKDAHKRDGKQALTKKKHRVVAVDYKPYLARITNLLSNPNANVGGHTTYSMSALAFALCAATGRRPIEVILTGEFEAIDANRLRFSGQAKKRFEEQSLQERTIYSLIDSNLVVQALKTFRSLPTVVDLVNSLPERGDYRTTNDMINNRTAPPFNQFTKDFFGDQTRVFKDTRAIYANICYTLWYDQDPEWAGKDPDVFYSQLLGHDDMGAQMHYKSIKLHGVDPEYKPKPADRTNRAKALEAFDDQMAGLATGGAAVRLHDAVKKMLVDEPNAKITQSRLCDGNKYGRNMVKRYMELCADALGIEKRSNGRWYQKDEAELKVLVEVDADDQEQLEEVGEPEQEAAEDQEPETKQEAEPEPQPEPKQAKPRTTSGKPRMDGEKLEDGRWRGSVTIGDDVVATATAGDKLEAMKQAWRRYEDDNAIATTTVPFKGKGPVLVEIKVLGRVVTRLEEKGDGDAVEAAAWKAFHNRS